MLRIERSELTREGSSSWYRHGREQTTRSGSRNYRMKQDEWRLRGTEWAWLAAETVSSELSGKPARAFRVRTSWPGRLAEAEAEPIRPGYRRLLPISHHCCSGAPTDCDLPMPLIPRSIELENSAYFVDVPLMGHIEPTMVGQSRISLPDTTAGTRASRGLQCDIISDDFWRTRLTSPLPSSCSNL